MRQLSMRPQEPTAGRESGQPDEASLSVYLPSIASLILPSHVPNTTKTRLALLLTRTVQTGAIPIPGAGLLLKHKVLPSLASTSEADLQRDLRALLPYIDYLLTGEQGCGCDGVGQSPVEDGGDSEPE